jgi:hypothetical protein
MKIPNKKISCIFLFVAISELFADKFIPHTHHQNGIGAIPDFSSDATQSDPPENEEAGEKIHSEFFNISELSHSLQLDNLLSNTNVVFAIDINFPTPDNPVFIIKKYFLLQKIININHLVIRYFTYKAPPETDVLKSQFNNQNIYRRSYYEENKGNKTAMV